MLFFPHLTRKEIRDNYTHLVLLFGVPMYANFIENDGDVEIVMTRDVDEPLPNPIREANWVPRPFYYLAMMLAALWLLALRPFGVDTVPLVGLREYWSE